MPKSLARRLAVPALAVFGGASPLLAHGLREQPHYPLPRTAMALSDGRRRGHRLYVSDHWYFCPHAPAGNNYPRANLLTWSIARVLAHPAVVLGLQLLSAGLFLLLLLVGFFGNQNPHRNILPTFVWVPLVGRIRIHLGPGRNLWAVINPWKILFRWSDALYRQMRGEGELSLHLSYPERLGVWPGFLLFVAFAWIELVYTHWAVPTNLAVLIIAYSAITWTGMFLFGREKWLLHGEAFSIAFGLLARFAPTEVRVTAREVCGSCRLNCRDRDSECVNCYACFERANDDQRELNLRPVAVGLLRPEVVSPSLAAFVLLMLSTVTFDGISVTPAWARLTVFLRSLSPDPHAPQALIASSAEIVIFLALFMSIYLVFCKLMLAASGSRHSVGTWARTFVFSLVPIALAFHLSHYLSFLLIQGQLIIPLASDPFGFGWDLFGTRNYWPDFGIVGVRFVWFTAVITIVLGHIIAVFSRRLHRFAHAWRSKHRTSKPISDVGTHDRLYGRQPVDHWPADRGEPGYSDSILKRQEVNGAPAAVRSPRKI